MTNVRMQEENENLESGSKPTENALWRFAGFPANRGLKLVQMLNEGLPVSILDNIHEWTEMSRSDILRVTGINERNVARRKSTGRTLTPEESERIARLVRVVDAAVQFFGNKRWRMTGCKRRFAVWATLRRSR